MRNKIIFANNFKPTNLKLPYPVERKYEEILKIEILPIISSNKILIKMPSLKYCKWFLYLHLRWAVEIIDLKYICESVS